MARQDESRSKKHRPSDIFRRVVAARSAKTRLRLLHPKRDRIWMSRTGDTYTVSATPLEGKLKLAHSAARSLARMVDVSGPLLARLGKIPVKSGKEPADTWLVNRLLWMAGDDPDFVVRLHVHDRLAARVTPKSYLPVHLMALANLVLEREERGDLRLERFDLTDDTLRLVVCFPRLDAVPIGGSGRSYPWYPGAVLLNKEDGNRSAITVPALVSAGGERTLPIQDGRRAVVRRRHTGDRPSELSERLVDDLAGAARRARFDLGGERLSELYRLPVAEGQAAAVLAATSLRLPRESLREQVLAKMGQRRSSQYWLVHHILSAASDLPGDSRMDLELAVGRLVWARGRRTR